MPKVLQGISISARTKTNLSTTHKLRTRGQERGVAGYRRGALVRSENARYNSEGKECAGDGVAYCDHRRSRSWELEVCEKHTFKNTCRAPQTQPCRHLCSKPRRKACGATSGTGYGQTPTSAMVNIVSLKKNSKKH